MQKNRFQPLQLSLQFSKDLTEPSELRQVLTRYRVSRWLRHAIEMPALITVRVVAEDEGEMLNKTYRAKNYPTNVLTFDYSVESELEADIVLCAPVVEKEARELGKTLEAHYAHLLVHGALHAQGWDHEMEDEAREMEAQESQILAKLGYANPYRDFDAITNT